MDLLRRRVARLGAARVAGQLVFQLGIAPILGRTASRRRSELLSAHGLDARPIPPDQCLAVPNINTSQVVAAIADFSAEVVVVNGTRILDRDLLASIRVPVVNLHAGITPRYRGVHGGFWALAEGKPGLFGVTLHRVDSGIDTGAVIAQAFVAPTADDNFSTYPVIQLVAGLSLLDANLPAVAAGAAPAVTPPDATSKLWSHPTVFEYLSARFRGRAR
jgi:methionyl-tRNA formyltransferase